MMQDAGRLVSGNAVPATRGPLYSYSFPSSEDTLEIRPCSSYHGGTMGPNRPGATPPPKRSDFEDDSDDLEEYVAVSGGRGTAPTGRYSSPVVRAGPSSAYRGGAAAQNAPREPLSLKSGGAGGGYRSSGSYGTPQDHAKFEDVTRRDTLQQPQRRRRFRSSRYDEGGTAQRQCSTTYV